jgi:hypothetical protein
MFIALRLILGLFAIATWSVGFGDLLIEAFASAALTHSIFAPVVLSPGGFVFTTMAMLLGAAIVIDLGLNDVIPNDISWRTAHRHRHYILAALAFCHVAQLYIAVHIHTCSELLFYYLISAGVLMFVAFRDAHSRKVHQC